jgi:nondiscriminating aspartyl-tRNA synthetase
MERILTTELAAHVGEDVLLRGWLHRQRRLSRVSFLILRDLAGLAQIVIDRPLDVAAEAVLEVHGRVVVNEQAPSGVEVHGAELTVIVAPAEAPPIELLRLPRRFSLGDAATWWLRARPRTLHCAGDRGRQCARNDALPPGSNAAQPVTRLHCSTYE